MIKEEVLQQFGLKNCVVTGGSGLIGRQLCEILYKAGAFVTNISLDEISPGICHRNFHGDLRNFAYCKMALFDADYVFHLAGVKGSGKVTETHPASFMVPMLQMNTNILEACRINKVSRVLFTSSIGAYEESSLCQECFALDGDPMDFYPGMAKRIGELQIQAYHKQYGLNNFAIVRPASCYGPGDNFDPENAMIIPSLIYKMVHEQEIIDVTTDGTEIRDFIFSKDVAEGMILACHYGTNSQPINLGSGVGVSIQEIVQLLNNIKPSCFRFNLYNKSSIKKRVMDISKAKRDINFQASVSLRDGLLETFNWYMNHKEEYLQKQNYFTEKN